MNYLSPLFHSSISFLNDNHHTSCNYPSIFYSFCPWTNTWYPRNLVPYPLHSRDKRLCPYTLLPILQTFSRTLCIYTVRTAYPFPPSFDFFCSYPFIFFRVTTHQQETRLPLLLHAKVFRHIRFPSHQWS